MTYAEQRAALITYLRHKVEISDWHGVSDAANDLRVLEAAQAAHTVQVEVRTLHYTINQLDTSGGN